MGVLATLWQETRQLWLPEVLALQKQFSLQKGTWLKRFLIIREGIF